MFYPISCSYLNPKGEDSRCKNWRIYGYLYIKTKMRMLGLIFEPHSPKFEDQYNFFRCLNHANMIFLFLRVSDFQRSVWSVLSISVAVLELPNQLPIPKSSQFQIWKMFNGVETLQLLSWDYYISKVSRTIYINLHNR